MLKCKEKNIFKQLIIIIIICEIAFTPLAICGQFQEYIQKLGKRFHGVQMNSYCCQKETNCPVESESDKSHSDSECRCICCDNIPSILPDSDTQNILIQNPYYTIEFQIKQLQPNQNIFHPPKQ